MRVFAKNNQGIVRPLIFPYLFDVVLHLKWRIKLLIAMLALRQVTEIQMLLLVVINMPLHMHHNTHVVVQHLVAIPTLRENKIKYLLKLSFRSLLLFVVINMPLLIHHNTHVVVQHLEAILALCEYKSKMRLYIKIKAPY